MWNRRKEDETAPRPATASPAASPVLPRETQPAMQPAPSRSYDSPSAGSATIGKAVMIKGQIFSREDLLIDGEVEGTVEAHEHRVTVGPNGKVVAGVKAREIVVQGAISGNVEATDKIDIRKDARLVGDIKTARIVIEDGAYFKGSIDITKQDARPAPRPAESRGAQPAPAQHQPAQHQPNQQQPPQQPQQQTIPQAGVSTPAVAPGK